MRGEIVSESLTQRYLTIPEIREMYQHNDQPLNPGTIRAVLEPLAGTSFLRRALDELSSTEKTLTANDLFLLYDDAFSSNVKCRDAQTRKDAVTSLALLSGCRVRPSCVSIMQWMEPDELLFREYRNDALYYDTQKTLPAGNHSAAQFHFYQAGVYLHTLAVSTIGYYDDEHRWQMYCQLSEGVLPHQRFSDANKPGLPFLDPRQSAFIRSSPRLLIGSTFSFAAVNPHQV
jgi:hypothetical protein